MQLYKPVWQAMYRMNHVVTGHRTLPDSDKQNMSAGRPGVTEQGVAGDLKIDASKQICKHIFSWICTILPFYQYHERCRFPLWRQHAPVFYKSNYMKNNYIQAYNCNCFSPKMF